jgi:hypothetical protein
MGKTEASLSFFGRATLQDSSFESTEKTTGANRVSLRPSNKTWNTRLSLAFEDVGEYRH